MEMEKDLKSSKLSLLTEKTTSKKFDVSSSLYPTLSTSDSNLISSEYIKFTGNLEQSINKYL